MPQRLTAPVAICVCTRNRVADLETCLAAIARSDLAPEQVIVSDDGEGAIAVQTPSALCVEFVDGPRLGLASNRNRALESVSSPYVLFIDDDCHLDPAFLSTALDALGAVDGAPGRQDIIVSGSETKDGQIVVAHEQDFLGFQHRAYGPGEALRTIVINATLFPQTLFREHRFDGRLRYGYEEVDIASRAVAAGYEVISVPAARNHHFPSPSSRDDYDSVVNASRLYATFKRSWWTERRRGRALAFAVVAPTHVLVRAVATRRMERIRAAIGTVRLAGRYTRSFRRERRTGI